MASNHMIGYSEGLAVTGGQWRAVSDMGGSGGQIVAGGHAVTGDRGQIVKEGQ